MSRTLYAGATYADRTHGYTSQGDVNKEEYPLYGIIAFRGYVGTPLGYVYVYSQLSERKEDCVTSLDIIINGQVYMRTIECKGYGPRYLRVIARQFAREMADKVGNASSEHGHKAEQKTPTV